MAVALIEESFTTLADYARIPIAFEVVSRLELVVEQNGLGGFTLTERSLDAPYVKDYDAIEGNSPLEWPDHFDMSNWGMIVAYRNRRRVGGAVVALDTPDMDVLERRSDLAVLWDLRVTPQLRRQGVGGALFQAAEQWAAKRGCRHLKAETQNVNVPACRFYARQCCVLGSVHRFAYYGLPGEVQLNWYKELRSQ